MRGQESGDRSQGTEDGRQRTEDSPLPFRFVDDPAAFRDDAALVVRIPAGIRSKQKLLGILAERLRFPGYFGWNWDALEECLRDLSWLPDGQRVVIVHEGVPFGAGGENRRVYLAILASAVSASRVLPVFAVKDRETIEISLPA